MGTREQILCIFLAALSISAIRAVQTPQSKTSRGTPKQTADVVIRAGAIHTMAQGHPSMRSIAIGGEVLAMSEAAHVLDAFVDSSTQVIDDPALTLLPGPHTPYKQKPSCSRMSRTLSSRHPT